MSKAQELQELVARGEARPDLTTPSTQGLAWLLRHREHWPKGFVWTYTHCTGCAMGLAHRLWGQFWPREPSSNEGYVAFVSAVLSMDHRESWNIFEGLRDRNDGLWDVAPDQVADALDIYLLRQENRA